MLWFKNGGGGSGGGFGEWVQGGLRGVECVWGDVWCLEVGSRGGEQYACNQTLLNISSDQSLSHIYHRPLSMTYGPVVGA